MPKHKPHRGFSFMDRVRMFYPEAECVKRGEMYVVLLKNKVIGKGTNSNGAWRDVKLDLRPCK